MIRYLLLGCLLLVACAAPDIRSYDNTYFGILQNACYPQARNMWISVWDGGVELPLPFSRRLYGTVTSDGDLAGSGTWVRMAKKSTRRSPVESSAHGDCQFGLSLAPRVRRTVNARLPRTGRVP